MSEQNEMTLRIKAMRERGAERKRLSYEKSHDPKRLAEYMRKCNEPGLSSEERIKKQKEALNNMTPEEKARYIIEIHESYLEETSDGNFYDGYEEGTYTQEQYDDAEKIYREHLAIIENGKEEYEKAKELIKSLNETKE